MEACSANGWFHGGYEAWVLVCNQPVTSLNPVAIPNISDAHKTAEAGGLSNIDLHPPVLMLSMYASAQKNS